jgi:predicted ATP-dependent endonuclease of OLD family
MNLKPQFKRLQDEIVKEKAFEEQFHSLFTSEDASKAINVVYVWRTEKPIPRLRGESDIIYIGKTKNSLRQRHARYASVEGSGLNLKRYEFILKTYGSIWVEYLDYPNTVDVHKKEQELLSEYFERHLEYPPLNRIAR